MYQELEIVRKCDYKKLRVKWEDLVALQAAEFPCLVMEGELRGVAFELPNIQDGIEWKLVGKEGHLYIIAIVNNHA